MVVLFLLCLVVLIRVLMDKQVINRLFLSHSI